MAHTRPMHAGHALGVRESQFSVFSGSSSAEDLLASLDDFPFVAPQSYVSLDGGRVPLPLTEEKEYVVHELQHSELPIPREHALLSDERDYLDRERLSPAQEEWGRSLVDPSRVLRTRPNVVMDHYDPDTNIHTFKIAYPSRGRSEQEHYGSPKRPTACASLNAEHLIAEHLIAEHLIAINSHLSLRLFKF
ncbi:hypothetical protein EWM64_g10304 [Hericium alpestre]|uniref:Uncharacterized protein n=1 Tax=Hericium alpestre TaxID=135208 RepID=A0A4Y9ZJ71_9AGAM|nr:hypothetical protein EWM64_g10304 [Hericium alpestre]